MIQHGTRPRRIDHRDFDFHKSFGTVGFDTNKLSTELNLDAGLWIPDQEQPETFAPTGQHSFSVPALPYGCTSYTTDELCIDEDGVLHDPMLIENVTHSNANGGGDIVTALNAAKQVLGRTAYYNVKAQWPLDWFDAFRVCMASTATEKRSISIGTPYFLEWEGTGKDGIAPTPSTFSPSRLPWHNWKVCGWKIIGDQPYLIGKTNQGSGFGDGGFFYVSRPLINNVMAIGGTVAYTLSKDTPQTIQIINTTWIEWIVSLIRNLIGL